MNKPKVDKCSYERACVLQHKNFNVQALKLKVLKGKEELEIST